MAVLIAAGPLAAHASLRIGDIRVTQQASDKPASLIVTTTADGASEADVVHAAVESADGTRKELACSPGTTKRTGTGGLPKLPTGKTAATLTLFAGDGKVLTTYAGALLPGGRLDLTDDHARAVAPAVSGFVFASGGTGGTALVTLEGAKSPISGGVLTVDGVKTQLAFGAEATEWGCGPLSAEKAWNFHVWTEVAKSPGRSERTVSRRDDGFKARVSAPWRGEDKGGVPTLAADDVGRTTVGLVAPPIHGCGWGRTCKSPAAHALVGFSTGWSAKDAIPAFLALDVEGGESLQLPLNSAQRTGAVKVQFDGDPAGRQVELVTDAGPVRLTAGDGRGVCMPGKCFSLAPDAGGWALIATAWALDAAKLPGGIPVAFTPAGGKDALVAPKEPKVMIPLREEVALVFARTVDFRPDAFGGPIAAKPSFIGLEQEGIHTSTATATGTVRRATLGATASAFSLATASTTGPAQSRGDLLIAGEPIVSVGGGGTTDPVRPPVVWEANGAGTRSAIPSTRNKPGLR